MIRKAYLPLAAAVMLSPAVTQAAVLDLDANVVFIERGTQANPQADIFSINNMSSTGVSIAAVTIDLTLATDSPVFDTLDGCSSYCFGAETGFPVTAVTGAGATGLIPLTTGDQASLEESAVLNLSFTDFETGEALLFSTDIDDLVDFFVPASQLAAASISVTFAGAGFDMVTLSANLGPVPGLPDVFASARVTGQVNAIPVPGALLLFSSALLGLAARRRRL